MTLFAVSKKKQVATQSHLSKNKSIETQKKKMDITQVKIYLKILITENTAFDFIIHCGICRGAKH